VSGTVEFLGDTIRTVAKATGAFDAGRTACRDAWSRENVQLCGKNTCNRMVGRTAGKWPTSLRSKAQLMAHGYWYLALGIYHASFSESSVWVVCTAGNW